MEKAHSVSIVLPAHNEEPNIKHVIRRCIEACEKHFKECEIIVVDDGSSDGTAEVVKELVESEPRIKLVRHRKNRGYGAALRSGFHASRMEWIFFTDSDGQFDPADISLLVPHLSNHDIIAGYRIRREDNVYRRLLGRVFTLMVNLFFGLGMKDVDCAFKFLRGDLVKGLPLTVEGALINTEILYHARLRGCRITQVGVNHYPRMSGEQSGGSLFVILKAIKEYWKLWLQLRAVKR